MQQPPDPNQQYPQQQWNPQQPPMPPQQQWQQQPPYPPQQYQQPPQYQPQMPPPKKKSRKGLFIVLGVILAVALVGCIGVIALVNAGGKAAQQAVNQTSTQVAQLPTTQPTTQPTTKPTQSTSQAKWTTVQTFTGNGNKKTAIFTAPNDWKILWSCKGLTDGTNIDGVIYISVYGSDNSPVDPIAVSGTCTYGKTTSDSTEEHQSGNVYLEVNTGLPWTIQVQELK